MTRFLSIDSEERSASKLIQIIGCIQFLEVEELRSLAPGLLVGSWLGNVLFSMFCFPGPCIRPSRNTNRKLDTFGEDFFFPFGCYAEQRLTQFCQENTLVMAYTLFQQHKRRLYPWTSPDGQHRNQIDYILCSQRWRNSIQSTKTRPGADCGSDHELLIAKFRLKLKKVGKTTRPFRYGLNQIPYDYTVEVRNRFKGLDLIEFLKNYGWRFMTLYRRQWSRPSPKKKKCKR